MGNTFVRVLTLYAVVMTGLALWYYYEAQKYRGESNRLKEEY